jgi:hypothetical protein
VVVTFDEGVKVDEGEVEGSLVVEIVGLVLAITAQHGSWIFDLQ